MPPRTGRGPTGRASSAVYEDAPSRAPMCIRAQNVSGRIRRSASHRACLPRHLGRPSKGVIARLPRWTAPVSPVVPRVLSAAPLFGDRVRLPPIVVRRIRLVRRLRHWIVRALVRVVALDTRFPPLLRLRHTTVAARNGPVGAHRLGMFQGRPTPRRQHYAQAARFLASRKSSRAAARVFAVILRPPSIRAISSLCSRSVRRRTVLNVRSARTHFSTLK